MMKNVLAMGATLNFILSGMGRLWRVLLLFAYLMWLYYKCSVLFLIV